MKKKLGKYRKLIVAALGALMIVLLPDQAQAILALDDAAAELIEVALAILMVFGVYEIPNDPEGKA